MIDLDQKRMLKNEVVKKNSELIECLSSYEDDYDEAKLIKGIIRFMKTRN